MNGKTPEATTSSLRGDPFAMLLDLDRVVSDMEHSERLQRLQRRVVHPLDLPSRSARATQAAQAVEFDRMVDEAPEEAPEEAMDDPQDGAVLS